MKTRTRRILRYFGLAVAILFFLWMAGLAAVYFFVDVNKVKKAALTYVNENTRGELSVGEVNLKLFPLVHFEVKDIVLKSSVDFDRNDLFKCSSAKLSFGLLSLIFGTPNISLGLESPYVNMIVKDKDTNNLSDLMIKKDPAKEAGVKEAEKRSPEEKKKDAMYYLFISKFTFDVNNAELKYTSPKGKYDVKSLSFKLMIDPADKDLELKAGSPLDIKDKKFSVAGDWKLDARVKPISDNNFDVSFMFDATKLSYTSASFVKPKGVPLKLELSGSGNQDLLTIKKAVFTLFKPWLTISGKIEGLKEETTPISLKVLASDLELSDVKKLLPALKQYDVSGKVNSRLAVSGSLQKMQLDTELDMTSASIKNESFNKDVKVPLKVKLVALKSKESIDIQLLKLWLIDDIAEVQGKITDLEAKESNIEMGIKYLKLDLNKLSKVIPAIKKKKITGSVLASGNIKGKMNPIPYFNINLKYDDVATKNNLVAKLSNSQGSLNTFNIDLNSTFLNLNPFMPPKDKKAGKKSESTAKPVPIDKKKPIIEKELVKSLNEMLSKYSLNLNAKVSKVLVTEFVLNNFVAQVNASKGVLSVNKFRADTLGGTLSSGLVFNSNIAKPSYKANFDVTGLKVKEALAVFMPELKGVMDGVLSGKIAVNAAGYTVGDVQKSLVGSGNFAFNNFVYSSKELNEALNQKLTEKLGNFSPTKGKNIFGGNPGWETVQGVFTIKDEKINIDKILAKEKEYLAEGKGNVDFNNYMDMNFVVTVPYKNLPYEPFKVDKKELSTLPLHLTGPVAKPKLDAAKLIQYFFDKTVELEKKKLKDKANKEVQKIKVQATDKLKQAIKGLKF